MDDGTWIELFRQTRRGKPEVWRIRREGAVVYREWGRQDGAMQTSSDDVPPVNVGKANERTGAEQAEHLVEKEVEDRLKEGFSRTGSAPVSLEVHPLYGPPTSFRFPKPIEHLPPSLMTVDCLKGRYEITRKHDGIGFPVFVNAEGSCILFDRKFSPVCQVDGESWNRRFPHIEDHFNRCASPAERNAHGRLQIIPPRIPPMTLFMTELVSPEKGEDGRLVDDLDYVGSVTRSATGNALDYQADHGLANMVLLDLLMLNGLFLYNIYTWEQRRNLLEQTVPLETFLHVCERMVPGRTKPLTPERAMEIMERRGWEGGVIVGLDDKWPDDTLNFRGREVRPIGWYKLIKRHTKDFIGTWHPEFDVGTYGRGKWQGMIGAIDLMLYNKETGQLEFVAQCGTGFTEEQRKDWADPEGWPKVVTVGFKCWTDEGSLREPVFIRPHPDKSVRECTR